MIAKLLSATCLGIALVYFVQIFISIANGDGVQAVKDLVVLLLLCFASWGFLPSRDEID
jgi:hypothetical protein